MTPAHEAPWPMAPLCAEVVALAVLEPVEVALTEPPLRVAPAEAEVVGGAVVLTAKTWVNDAVVVQELVAGAACADGVAGSPWWNVEVP